MINPGKVSRSVKQSRNSGKEYLWSELVPRKEVSESTFSSLLCDLGLTQKNHIHQGEHWVLLKLICIMTSDWSSY